MRHAAKGRAPYGQGISAATCYDSGIKSAATDLEALIDRFGKDVLHTIIDRISEDMREHGDSIYNYEYNIWLKSKPLPKIRKRGATRAEQMTMKKAIELARKEAIARGDKARATGVELLG